MKKFATPLAINGSEQELRKLIPQLENLGYRWDSVKDDYGQQGYNYLVTGYTHHSRDGEGLAFYSAKDRLIVPASSPDLVLALAAMTEGKNVEIGECVFIIDGRPGSVYANGSFGKRINRPKEKPRYYGGQYWKPKSDLIYIQRSDNDVAGLSPECELRKATVQEIIDHFSKQTDGQSMMPQINKTPEKKIIGYKVKSGINREAAAKALGEEGAFAKESYGWDFMINSLLHNKAERNGLLDPLFEPVYEQEKKFIEITHGKRSDRKNLKGEIVKSTHSTALFRIEGRDFYKENLQQAIRSTEVNGVKFTPTYFDIGCSGQYHKVSAQDIQTVIDALD